MVRYVPTRRNGRDVSRREFLGAALSPLVAIPRTRAEVIRPNFETEHAMIERMEAGRLRLLLPAREVPVLRFKPASGTWDWSLTSKLVVPIDNPGGEPVTLRLEVESVAKVGAERRSLTGKTAIEPRSGANLTVWLAAPPPRSMGMDAGPSLAVAGLEPDTLPLTATTGAVDLSRIASVRLSASPAHLPRRLMVGLPRVAAPSAAEKRIYSYVGIVDGFGQFRPGHWPEKVGSAVMLRATVAAEARRLARPPIGMPVLDRFGGLDGAHRFPATGFFRTERRDGRWWLVTPAGRAFFSIGIDVVAPVGATYVEGREFMFHDLPAPNAPLAAHWGQDDDRQGLGAQRGRRFDHGRTFDFYTANLERKFGSQWRRRWREESSMRLRAWGFNTIGNWSDPGLWAMHRLPYTAPLYPEPGYATVSSGENWWGPMPDPFDPKFAASVDDMARTAARQFAGDPYLIGYFVQNELSWGSPAPQPRQRYSIAIGALAAGSDSPAKATLVAQLARTYKSAERLGRAWAIRLDSWNELLRAGFALSPVTLDRPAVKSDFGAFTAAFAEAYFRLVSAALHRHDPDHLYLGCRFSAWTPEALAAAARWCDVVSFNLYERSIAADPARWADFQRLGKPALIGEFNFGAEDRGIFWVDSNRRGRDRGHAYARYLFAVADNPDFVGAHWFAYVDEPLTGRSLDGENGNAGFVTVGDVPYRDLVVTATAANIAVLQRLSMGR